MKKTVEKGIVRLSQGVFQVSYMVNGRRSYETIHTTSLKEVRNRRNQLILEASTAQRAITPTGFDLDAAWHEVEQGILSKGHARKTLLGYRERFWRVLKEYPLDKGLVLKNWSDLDSGYFNRYFSWYVQVKGGQENPSSESRQIRAILSKLRALGFITKIHHEEIKDGLNKYSVNLDDDYLDIPNTELKKLFDFMAQDYSEYCDYFKFLLLTGRRPNEVAKIPLDRVIWNGLDPVNIVIAPKTAKNRRRDEILLHPEDIELKKIIINARNRSISRGCKYLFCNRGGKKISYSNIQIYLPKATQQVIGNRFTAKYFRKRYCTECGKNRVPIKDAMARSGHRDVKVFIQNYQQQTPDGLRAVIKAVGI